MLTKIDIFSQACVRCGEPAIQSFMDNTPAAQLARQIWDIEYANLLSQHNWVFALSDTISLPRLAHEIPNPDYPEKIHIDADPEADPPVLAHDEWPEGTLFDEEEDPEHLHPLDEDGNIIPQTIVVPWDRFLIPSNCLMLAYCDNLDYYIQGNYIIIEEETPNIINVRYIQKINENYLPLYFVDALVYKLAAQIALTISGDKNMHELYMEKFETAFRRAKKIDTKWNQALPFPEEDEETEGDENDNEDS